VPRYRLTIAYDGSDFCGWQKQSPPEEGAPAEWVLGAEEGGGLDEAETAEAPAPEAPSGEAGAAADGDRPRVELRTVQAVVERAVRAVVREPVILLGASRTDSGVHAKGQVGAFTCSDDGTRGIGWPLVRGTESLVKAINSRLPRDVMVMDAAVAAHDFNPIQGATSKSYSYTIWNGPTRPLWERKTALHIWSRLDVERMKAAARLIEGEHDFAAFAAAGHGRLSTVRTVFGCTLREEAAAMPETRRIVIDVTGSGFLWNMVRIIAGTLVEVGRGRMGEVRVLEALRTGKRELAGPTLQPQGLCLEWIKYE
jgi:tRNA pseudouridine38-40 synthase